MNSAGAHRQLLQIYTIHARVPEPDRTQYLIDFLISGLYIGKSIISMEKKSKFRRFLTKVGSVRLSQIWNKFKKPFNFCWKTGLAIVAIIFVVNMVEALVDTCKDHLGLTHYYWGDEDLGKNIEIRHFSNNQVATYNKKTDERLSPKVRWISCVPERDSLTVFCDKEGKRGYLNVNTGKVVIGGQYSHAWHFSEGLAAVVADNGKVGFINYDNEMVIPAVYDYVAGYDYLFEDGHCVLVDGRTNKYGAIDRQGNMKLPMEYSRIFKGHGETTWYIRKNGKCGLADADMNLIFEPVYDNIKSNSRAGNAYLRLGGVKQLVAFDGEVLLPFVIDQTWPLKYMVRYHDDQADEYELHPYLVEVMVDYDCFGVMDSRTGKMVIPAVYSDITMISKDLLMAEIGGDEETNVIFTTDGKMQKCTE